MFKATRKDITETYPMVVRVGYCGIYSMLYGIEKIAYNTGVYGWNWSCYRLNDNVAIVTGYRNLVGKRCPREEEFEERAREILDLRDWEKEKKLMNELREEFIEYCENTYSEWK